MVHQILFDGVPNDWNTALPLGNGRMGAMVFFRERALHIALNQYDCYYAVLPRYARQSEKPSSASFDELYRNIIKAREAPDYIRSHYAETLHPTDAEDCPADAEARPAYQTASHPMAGEVIIPLGSAMEPDSFSLALRIEEGMIAFRSKGPLGEAGADIWIAKSEDGLFTRLTQTMPGLWGRPTLVLPSEQGQGSYRKSRGAGDDYQWCKVEFQPQGELDPEHRIAVETAVLTEPWGLTAAVSRSSAVRQVRRLAGCRDVLEKEHIAAGKSFGHATVTLPDQFLETLWHLHLYLIDCASGLAGRYPEQACGLNGLWDIRRPTLWGSMWYWDVNIQSAFWPVFSANRLELGKLFCEGYLRYAEDAKAFAREVYGIDGGWALDYPHAFYNAIQPWCAQFLWRYYQYSGDAEFLRNKAYPVFQEQIAFFRHIARTDERGGLHIDPDISPEQGPVTRDSVITIAAVKQLLQYAVKAAGILQRPASEAAEYRDLLHALPDYPRTADRSRFKDSELAPDDLFLRHPSVLMPIFPAEEIGRSSPEGLKKLAVNTLKFASRHTETGVFGFGWLSCAAAKMGEGSAALRLLYEEGLDHVLHANGLGYEESERFINYCLVTKPPLFAPAMTEPSGGIVMAVNMMLMQWDDAADMIEVFPALPDGRDGLLEHRAQYRHHDRYLNGGYPAWDNCKFENLLAPGGFEVSAERHGGETVWLRVTAQRNGILKLRLPAGLRMADGKDVFIYKMSAADTVEFGAPADTAGTKTSGDQERKAGSQAQEPGVQVRKAAFTHRRISLGENRHTVFYKAVDAFTCSYRAGNEYSYPMTQQVFDFGVMSGAKNYDEVYHRQFFQTRGSLLFFAGPRRIGREAYQADCGYGFADAEGLLVHDRCEPDALRRDFVAGRADHEFWIVLPKGKYDLLVISGDESEASLTHLMLPHIDGRMTGTALSAGAYQCRVIPFVWENDGVFRLGFGTEAGYQWKLNAIFLNKEYTC